MRNCITTLLFLSGDLLTIEKNQNRYTENFVRGKESMVRVFVIMWHAHTRTHTHAHAHNRTEARMQITKNDSKLLRPAFKQGRPRISRF